MGNQLCPTKAKDIITELAEIQKGQIPHYTYQTIFRTCLNNKNLQKEEIDFISIKSHSNKDQYFLLKLEENVMFEHQNQIKIHQKLMFKQSNEKIGSSNQKKQKIELNLPNGWKYIGQVQKGIPHGQGEQYMPNGEYYKGDFYEGYKTGFGEYRFINGDVYRGQFKNNIMEGKGQYHFNNGDIYKGNFHNNMRNGDGKYKNFDKNRSYIGQYKNDLKNGHGQCFTQDTMLQGEWRNGLLLSNLNKQMMV